MEEHPQGIKHGLDQQPPRRSWWGRHWKWAVPVVCVVPLLCCGGLGTAIVALVFGVIKSSDPYTESLAIVQANALAKEELGEPIEAGWFVTGNIQVSGSSGHADISYSVSGNKGSGHVYVVARKDGGDWQYTTLTLTIEGSPQTHDLLPHTRTTQ